VVHSERQVKSRAALLFTLSGPARADDAGPAAKQTWTTIHVTHRLRLWSGSARQWIQAQGPAQLFGRNAHAYPKPLSGTARLDPV